MGSPASARHGSERLAICRWSSGITSSEKMDAAEAAGRAIEVGSNFFLFFSSQLSLHGGH